MLAVVALFIATAQACTHLFITPYSTAYWVWAGISPQDAPANAQLYVYQGLIVNNGHRTLYKRLGLYPHPLRRKNFYLSYRLEGQLPDVATMAAIFTSAAKDWQRHGVIVRGVQLDFDSPTGKLLYYGNFLHTLRQQLPPHYALSITGLGDWIGNTHAMRPIVATTNEVVFQLYQGWYPLPNMHAYVTQLARYPLPFKVGLLARYNNKNWLAQLQKNSNFKGVVYFLQRSL